MYKYYITKLATNYGLTSTRPIYERAITYLPDKEAKDMCLRFAEMERSIGEIDRARAIYAHASQFCDPRTVPSFWKIWHEFEVKHGNEETYAEMLRIKRSVQAEYNMNVNYISNKITTQTTLESSESSNDAMAILEKSKILSGFVSSSTGPIGGQHLKPSNPSETLSTDNPDAIELDNA